MIQLEELRDAQYLHKQKNFAQFNKEKRFFSFSLKEAWTENETLSDGSS